MNEKLSPDDITCAACDRSLRFAGGVSWMYWHYGTKHGQPRIDPICVNCFTPIIALRRMFSHLRRACL